MPIAYQRGVRCLKCNTEVYSNSERDFQTCKCKEGGVTAEKGWESPRFWGDLEHAEWINRLVDIDRLPAKFRED